MYNHKVGMYLISATRSCYITQNMLEKLLISYRKLPECAPSESQSERKNRK